MKRLVKADFSVPAQRQRECVNKLQSDFILNFELVLQWLFELSCPQRRLVAYSQQSRRHADATMA